MYKATNNDISIITQEDIQEIPNGPIFTSKEAMFLVHEDFTQITYFSKMKQQILDIKSTKLDPTRDSVKYVGLLNAEKVYIYSIRNKVPTGFLISLVQNDIQVSTQNNTGFGEQTFKLPKIVSFSLSSLVFHKQILTSFIPYPNCFCIVSKEGISIHSITLKTLYSFTTFISKCCFVDNFLLFTDRFFLSIFQFEAEKAPSLRYKKQINDLGAPHSILALSHSLVLVFSDHTQNALLQKIPLFAEKQQNPISLQKYFTQDTNINTLTFNVLDDALLMCDLRNNRTVLLDILGSEEIQIGFPFASENVIHSVFNNTIGVCPKKMFKLKIHYETIKDDSPLVIAALFRRSAAIQQAVFLLSQRLRDSKTVESMKNVVDIIATSAISPVAQIRFVRAIQYSSISDPHLILLALLRFSIILGPKMIDDARIALIEAAMHSACKNTFRNLLNVWGIKLNAHSLRIIAGKSGHKILIDAENVEDVLVYADICIDFDNKEMARKLILRFVLDQGKSSLDLGSVRKKFMDKFGEDALQPSIHTN